MRQRILGKAKPLIVSSDLPRDSLAVVEKQICTVTLDLHYLESGRPVAAVERDWEAFSGASLTLSKVDTPFVAVGKAKYIGNPRYLLRTTVHSLVPSICWVKPEGSSSLEARAACIHYCVFGPLLRKESR